MVLKTTGRKNREILVTLAMLPLMAHGDNHNDSSENANTTNGRRNTATPTSTNK